jgi:hypothetical protein
MEPDHTHITITPYTTTTLQHATPATWWPATWASYHRLSQLVLRWPSPVWQRMVVVCWHVGVSWLPAITTRTSINSWTNCPVNWTGTSRKR